VFFIFQGGKMQLNLNVNMTAFRASNRLQGHYSRLSQTVQRLSSGLRLNSAEDSPVDMTVHNLHNGRVATLQKGRQNIMDAISMVQTAESAMARIDEMLIKMKEIATQAANGIYTEAQRQIFSSEFGQFAAEIDRVARSTQFKGIKLIDGSLSARNNLERLGTFHTANTIRPTEADLDPTQNGLKIHFGPGNQRMSDYYFIRIGDLTMDGLLRNVGDPNSPSPTKIAVSTQHASQVALETITTAMLQKETYRYIMGIMQNRLETTLRGVEDEIYNINYANSALADADIAKEMLEYSRLHILAEASTAMLAQANVLPRMALKLLNF